MLKKWLLAIGIEKKICESWRICSRHFKGEDFRYSLVGGKRFLKNGAVPSRHLNGVVKDDQISDSQDNQISIFKVDQSMSKVLNIADLKVEEPKNGDQSLHIIKIKEAADTGGNTCRPTQLVSHSEPQVSER